MYSEEELDSAVAAGVLDADAATAFRIHVARLRGRPWADEEGFRLMSGFNDIFVTIAAVLLLFALQSIGGAMAPWLGSWLVALTAWPLAEVFTRRRRMALPSIMLLLAFVWSAAMGAFLLIDDGSAPRLERIFQSGGAASAVGILAAWLHWRRFQVPITVAAGAGACVLLAFAAVAGTEPSFDHWTRALSFLAGLTVFWFAMRGDMADRSRGTRRSDVAFWLHLLAAPLLVGPVFMGLQGVASDSLPWMQVGAVLALYLTIALVSLAIDRRALMASALGYVLYALAQAVQSRSPDGHGFAYTAVLLSAGLLLLSACWKPCRAAVLARLPQAWRTRLPPAG